MTIRRAKNPKRVYHPSNEKEKLERNRKCTKDEDLSCPTSKLSIVDPIWEIVDPTPDVHELFVDFDSRFFEGKLKSVKVFWSKRMTVTAGTCSYDESQCSIRLSEPLLKLRPRRDLVETLLHEMIHAYLHVIGKRRGRREHGPEFRRHMKRINDCAGTKITVYHDFHDEIESYQHWWKCNGPCTRKPPLFGFIKRSFDRPPGPRDIWWSEHQATCSGHFAKIREPVGYRDGGKKTKKKKKENGRPTIERSISFPDVRQFITLSSERSSSINPSQPSSPQGDIAVTVLEAADCPVCSKSVPVCSMEKHLDAVHFV
ncbi:hypothetical protein Aperf_G00000104582 [Anoplocephala perfoliata]